jgi:hypothetical protein
MNKEFTPPEQSLDLKELGFNEPCFKFYIETGELIPASYSKEGTVYPSNSDLLPEWTASPTYSQAFRWFRENHNLMFQIFYLCNGNYAAIIHRTTPEYMDLVDQVRPSSGCVDEVVDCYSYEEAELECLKKLIEIVKNK